MLRTLGAWHEALTPSHLGGLMRFVNIYLIGYFLLVLGALAALWYGGILRQISPVWIIIGLVVAFGLGIMLSVSAGKPEITRES